MSGSPSFCVFISFNSQLIKSVPEFILSPHGGEESWRGGKLAELWFNMLPEECCVYQGEESNIKEERMRVFQV
jgi:hypothetical protein